MNGYGKVCRWLGGKHFFLAHRFYYTLFVAPIGEGLDLDHLCRNPRCVNPKHLEAVTRQENILRSPIAVAARQSRQTHCGRGHAFNATNTYRAPGNPKRRYCRACQRQRAAV